MFWRSIKIASEAIVIDSRNIIMILWRTDNNYTLHLLLSDLLYRFHWYGDVHVMLPMSNRKDTRLKHISDRITVTLAMKPGGKTAKSNSALHLII